MVTGVTMKPADHASIVRLLLDSQAVRFGQFTLTSGRTSDVYVDIKRVWTNPDYLDPLAAALADRFRGEDRLAGMELGAVPLVVATALRVRRPYIVVRKAPREHGTEQRLEGEVPRGGRILLIEDVATTGGSAAQSIDLLRAAGGSIDRALVVVDRGEGASERLSLKGVKLESLVTLADLRESRT